MKLKLEAANVRKKQFIENQKLLPSEAQTPLSSFPVIKPMPNSVGLKLTRMRHGRRRRSNQEYIAEMKCDRMFIGSESADGVRSGSTFENVSFSNTEVSEMCCLQIN